MKKFVPALLITFVLLSVGCSKKSTSIEAGALTIEINNSGYIVGLDGNDNTDYSAKDTLTPLLAIRINGELKMSDSK